MHSTGTIVSLLLSSAVESFSPQLIKPRTQVFLPSTSQLGLYRKFHERGWATLSPDADNISEAVPQDLRTNSSPVKNSDSNVAVEIRSTANFPGNTDVLRLARSALLETQTARSDVLISPMTIHVLNFVIFPSTSIRDRVTGEYVGLPIFGADIVSLPGNKHLVAVDFQPVLSLSNEALLPERYSALESKLKVIHASYQDGESVILPWGGDIPPQAKRFFSPYALWTRLSDDDAVDKVETVVWNAFQDYLDLYMEMIREAQRDLSAGMFVIDATKNGNRVAQGQMDYLEYRRANDPARPMLQRLYGEEWTERVIAEVLFPDLKQ